MKIKTVLALLVFPVVVFAHAHFPKQCRVSGVKFSHGSVSLFSQHTAMPRLYAIHNISSHAIWLSHESKNPSASAGWSSNFLPNHWTAVLVTKRIFNLQCQIAEKSGMKNVSCKKVIQVCQFSHFYSKNPMSGGYWVVENVLFPALEPRMKMRGFSFNRL